MKVFKHIIGWFRKEPVNFTFWIVSDIPETLESGIIYLIQEESQIWLAVLVCPCGCKDLIHLNLLSKSNPCWRVFIDKKWISLYPSVWKITGCKSHFIIRRGMVKWCDLKKIKHN